MNKIREYLKKRDRQNILYTLLYAVFPKKYYWYQVKYVYRDKVNGKILFDFQGQVGLVKQNTINNQRRINKINIPLHKMDSVNHLLCNGILSVETICYLGKFSNGI